MRARTLLALLPVAFATAFSTALVPAASAADAYPSQNCSTAAPSEQVANAYTVAGTLIDREYVFVDVVERGGAIEVCFRAQFRLGAGWMWEGDYFRFPGAFDATAAAYVNNDTSPCTDVLHSGEVGAPGDPFYTPFNISTGTSGTAEHICITAGAIGIRVTADVAANFVEPTWESDCCGLYQRPALFPTGGSESGTCGDAKIGSSYLVTQNSRSFLRRDEPTNNICFRVERGSRAIGGRIETFAAAGYLVVGLTVAPCDTNPPVFTTGMLPPLLVTINTSTSGEYVCAKVNGTEVSIKTNGITPVAPQIHFDA